MLIFDIETNGFLEALDKLHCITILDTEDGAYYRAANTLGLQHKCDDGDTIISIDSALQLLQEASDICGQNIIEYDIPAIQKLYPEFKPTGRVWDTLILSRLIYTNLRELDLRKRKAALPPKLVGSHGLEAWGLRLGEWKGDYAEEAKEQGKDPWEAWCQEMDDYCKQDVTVTEKLWLKLQARNFGQDSIELEHEISYILRRQERYGVAFNVKAALALEELLMVEKAKLAGALELAFPPWEVKTPFTPKVNSKKFGYVKGVPTYKVKQIVFNPSSRDHVANRLTKMYGWKPSEFTDTGKPVIDEDVLSAMSWPEAKILSRQFLLDKRLSMLSVGKEAWMKAEKNGRIHGRVMQNGAVTGRMTHSKPNMAQVPKVGTEYGVDCRALFGKSEGKILVGADASGLELRCLAHYMAKWDGGAYVKTVVEGKQSDGTDVHSVNCVGIGLEPQKLYIINGKQVSGRDCAKTFIYAYLYGAGDGKLGTIVGKGPKHGAMLRKQFLATFPALSKLVDIVKVLGPKQGYLRGPDGREIVVRSPHAALNTLLQGAGAIVMKRALVLLDTRLQARGYVPGVDYEFVLNVHDEWQIECWPDIAVEIGEAAIAAIKSAGDHYDFRCPLSGAYKIGQTWAETH